VGAPLSHVDATRVPAPPLEEIVTAGLRLAHVDATVARTLPIVLSRNRARLRLDVLIRAARDAGEGAALGFFLDLTSELTDDPHLAKSARALEDTRPLHPTYFFTVGSDTLVGGELAASRTPPAGRRWNYLLNMPFDSFETLFRKHSASHGQR
jgi:hypothetical protein